MNSITPPIELQVKTQDGEQFNVELRHDRWSDSSELAQLMIPMPLNQKVFVDHQQAGYYFDALDLNAQLAWAVVEDGMRQGELFGGQVSFVVRSTPGTIKEPLPAFIYQVITPESMFSSTSEDTIDSEVDFSDPILAEMVVSSFPGTGIHVKAVEPQCYTQEKRMPDRASPIGALAKGAVAWVRRTYNIDKDYPVAALIPQLQEALKDFPSSIKSIIVSAASHINGVESFDKHIQPTPLVQQMNEDLIAPFLTQSVLEKMQQLDPMDVDRFLPLVPAGMDVIRQKQSLSIAGESRVGVAYYAAERHSDCSGKLFCFTEKDPHSHRVNLYSGEALERLALIQRHHPENTQKPNKNPTLVDSPGMKRQ